MRLPPWFWMEVRRGTALWLVLFVSSLPWGSAYALLELSGNNTMLLTVCMLAGSLLTAMLLARWLASRRFWWLP